MGVACDERAFRAMELINAMVYIAANRSTYTKVRTLANKFGQPKQRVESQMRKLTADGILERKPNYGVRLIKRPDEITVSDILDSVGILVEPLPCFDFFKIRPCAHEEACFVKPFVKLVNNTVRDICDRCTLDDVMRMV